MNENTKKARKIVKENRYMVIASVSTEGKAWITPVFFAYDEKYNLFWVSNKKALHSIYIDNNPNIAIVIFDSTKGEGEGDALYIEAQAREVIDDNEINHIRNFYDERAAKDELRIKEPANIKGEKAWRAYKAVPVKVFKSGDPKYDGGQRVDARIEVSL